MFDRWQSDEAGHCAAVEWILSAHCKKCTDSQRMSSCHSPELPDPRHLLDGWVNSDWLTAENLVQLNPPVCDWQLGLHYPAGNLDGVENNQDIQPQP